MIRWKLNERGMEEDKEKTLEKEKEKYLHVSERMKVKKKKILK